MIDLLLPDKFPFGDFSKYTELGDNHWFAFVSCACPDAPDTPHGLVQPHLTLEGWCGGSIAFAGHKPGKSLKDDVWTLRPTWTLVSFVPLHIEPMLVCSQCGDHGYIRDDAWEEG